MIWPHNGRLAAQNARLRGDCSVWVHTWVGHLTDQIT